MANRNSVPLMIPGNPLGSVLRETARQARRSTRDASAEAPATASDLDALKSEVDELQNSNAALQTQIDALRARLAAATLVTGVGGLGSWTYPAPFSATPSVVATVQGGAAYHVSIVSPGPASTQFLVLDMAGAPVVGATVNLIAMSLT